MSGDCLSNGRDGTLATRSARNRKAFAMHGGKCTCSPCPPQIGALTTSTVRYPRQGHAWCGLRGGVRALMADAPGARVVPNIGLRGTRT